MDSKHYDIKMGSVADWAVADVKTYSCEFQTAKKFANGWKSVLQTAHAVKDDAKQRKVIQCQCNGSATKEGCCLLEVRELEGTYFLAKRKHTGMQHKDSCRFFQVDWENSGLKAYSREVVDDNGRIKVGLGLQMRNQEDQVETPAPSRLPKRNSCSERHRALSLLGLLQIIWNAAGLNYCKPSTIKLRSNLPYRLAQHATSIKISRQSLAKHLLIYDMVNNNKNALKFAVENNRRLFVIAPLAQWVSQENSELGVLPIETPAGIPDLHLLDGLWAATCNRFERSVNAWRGGKRTIAIAQIEPRKAPASSAYECTVVGLALMRVTDDWLPVESNYEQIIADELVAAGRRFIKPLRYDADEDDVFPDFILLDTGDSRGTPMEVFGMTSRQYAERQAVKTAYYNEAFGLTGWWSWIPKEEPTHKNFPPKVV